MLVSPSLKGHKLRTLSPNSINKLVLDSGDYSTKCIESKLVTIILKLKKWQSSFTYFTYKCIVLFNLEKINN